MEDYNAIANGVGRALVGPIERLNQFVRRAERQLEKMAYKMQIIGGRILYETLEQKSFRLKVEGAFQEYVDGLNSITPYRNILQNDLLAVEDVKEHGSDSFDAVIVGRDHRKRLSLNQLDKSLVNKLRQIRQDYYQLFPSKKSDFIEVFNEAINNHTFEKRGEYRSKEDIYYFSIASKLKAIAVAQELESCKSPIEVAYSFRPKMVWFDADKQFLRFYKKYKDEKFVDALFSQFEQEYRVQKGTYFDGELSAENIDFDRFKAAFAHNFQGMLAREQFELDEEDELRGGMEGAALRQLFKDTCLSSKKISDSWQKLMFYSVVEKLKPNFDQFLDLLQNFYNSQRGNEENRKIDDLLVLKMVGGISRLRRGGDQEGRAAGALRSLGQYVTEEVHDEFSRYLAEVPARNTSAARAVNLRGRAVSALNQRT